MSAAPATAGTPGSAALPTAATEGAAAVFADVVAGTDELTEVGKLGSGSGPAVLEEEEQAVSRTRQAPARIAVRVVVRI
jgi:hypothetical protein